MSKPKKVDGLFDGRHFDREIIILCVRRWYLRYKLSLRDLVEMISERGIGNLLARHVSPLAARYAACSRR